MNSDELLMARLRRYEHPTMDEGADRIQRLLAENEMLREELAKHQSKGYARMACSFAAQIFSLREVLEKIANDAVPRTVHVAFRKDKLPNKNDKCPHGRSMWDDCAGCISEYARAALAEEKES